MARKPITEAERFWRHVDIRGENECWPWMGNRQKKSGYGLFNVAKDESKSFGLGNCRSTTAHRKAYELATGERIPDKLHALHSCDNPPCCNPAHVSPGTQKENIDQMYDRGRQPNTHVLRHIGENHGRCVVSDEQVVEMRRLYREQKISQQRLGIIYGIGQSQVSRILREENRAILTPRMNEAPP